MDAHVDNPAPVQQPGRGEHFLLSDTFAGRVSTLHEIALQIDAARSNDDIMAVLRSEVRWILPVQICFACRVDHFHTHYTITSLSAAGDSLALDRKSFDVKEGDSGTVIQNQSPLYVRLDADGHRDVLGAALCDAGMRSMLIVPLRTGDETVGALAFASPEPEAYHEQELVLAQLLATQTAIALQNTALFEDAKKRIAQIELVNELAEDLTSTLELDALLAAAADTIRKTFSYYDVSIFLVDRLQQEAYVVAHAGAHPDVLPKGFRQKFSEGIVGWAISHDERVVVDDVSADPRYVSYSDSETVSELVIPIHVEHEIVGVLNVEDKRPAAFDETDAIVLETLCDQLGSAIKNAQLYDQVKRANAQLTELDKMKSDFLGIVSHDFRSPLASIVLAAKGLLKRPDAVDRKRLTEYLQLIVDQANKLVRLAEDTLSMTKMEAGQLKYFFNMVSLERLIKDAMGGVNLTSRHTMTYEIDPRVEYVRGDQTKLRQVLQNLLSNAVKYSPAGGRITIRAAHHSADHLIVAVSDEGIGIPQDQVSRLFQKFSRIDTPQAREIKGSGLGLWICKEIVRAHGGVIWVDQNQGKGSTFAFTLRKAHPDAGQE